MSPSEIIKLWQGKANPDKLFPIPDEVVKSYLNFYPSIFSFDWNKNKWSKELQDIAKKIGVEDIFLLLELFYANRLKDDSVVREIMKHTGIYFPKARDIYLAEKNGIWTVYPKGLIDSLRSQGLDFKYKVDPKHLPFLDFAVNLTKTPSELPVLTTDFIYSVKRNFPIYAQIFDFFYPETTQSLKNKSLKNIELPTEIYTKTRNDRSLISFTKSLSELETQQVDAAKVVENIAPPSAVSHSSSNTPPGSLPSKLISSQALLKRWGRIAVLLGAGAGLLYFLSKRKKAQTLELEAEGEQQQEEQNLGFLPVLSPDVFSAQAKALEQEYTKLKKEYLDKIQKIKQISLISKLSLASNNVNLSLSELIAIELQTIDKPELKPEYIRGLYNSKRLGIKVKHPDELLAYSKIDKNDELERFIDDYIKLQKEELDLYENELQNIRKDISYLHRQSLLAQAWTIKETNRRLWQTYITNIKEKQNKILNMLIREVEQ